ncbi:MAG: hypothetical protein K2H21_07100 [Muribaculaceae bacterium]|nr:hypothetical protein [Muribaculaceae bacterium]
MSVVLIILSCLLWVSAFVAFPRRILLSPALSFCALLLLSFARIDGVPIVPVANSMTLSWLCITLVVMMVILLQNPAIRIQSRGTGYILFGAVAGMAAGLAVYTVSASTNLLYTMMLGGTAIGIILGLLIFSNTPAGRAIAPSTGHFWQYLLAKGFPALITVAQIGIALVILIATYRNPAL